jgi:sulfinoalanine decarboxylase
MTSKNDLSYSRTSLFSTEQFEVVRCEWSLGDGSPMHGHHWSQCFTLIEEGVFENTTLSGFKTTKVIGEPGQVLSTPAGTEHDMKCISPKGKTLHIYTPKIPDFGKHNNFQQPTARALQEKLALGLSQQGLSWENLNSLMASVYQSSISTESIYFMNQLFSGVLPENLLSSEVLSKTRTTMATFEASPVYSLIEMEVVQKLGELIGWPNKSIDGVSVPGGSAANFMALHCARQNRFPEFKTAGIYQSRPLKLFVSEDSHYSLKKACVALGLGSDSLVTVRTDINGRMLISDLDLKISRCLGDNEIPLMVCATAGTTVYGSFDPIESISELCKKHNMWLHVDGAWGGPALFSKKIRSHLNGIEKADSMTFDSHKLFGANLTSSVFISKHPQILLQANDVSGADYLFHNNSEVIDRGRLSWQCGRSPDAFAFWTLWKSYGSDGLGGFVDRLLDVTKQSIDWIKTQPRLHLISEPGYLNICVQVVSPQNPSDKNWSAHVRERLIEKNLSMVNYSTTPDGLTFLRMILSHPQIEFAHVKQILEWALEVK